MSEVEVVICVRSSDENSSPSLQEAFEALTKNGFRTEWMTPEECLQIKEKIRTMAFIFDPFVGEAFTHLCNLGFRILGPQCVLSSLYMKIELPKNFPVYNLAMKNLVVSCSCIDKSIREEIYKKVTLMAGSVSKEFTHYVTHLISGEVGSKKYQVAVELKKEIMSPEWVQAVWEKSRHRHVHASDELFSKYRCPIFKGFNISVSGLEPAERKEVRNLIESEGGESDLPWRDRIKPTMDCGLYSGEMKMNTCTHLVINHPTGTKYEFALKWKIKTVCSKWVYDSIENGYCLLEDDYRTDPISSSKKSNQQTSTPTKNSTSRMQESHINDISSICNYSSVTNVGETTMFQSNRQLASIQDQSVLNLDIDLNKTTKVLFLDGLKIYLSGFRNPNLDKLRKIINAGGATRFNNINEGVTHVVIGDTVDSDINLLKTGEYRPFAVSAQWLIDCYNEEKHLDETTYLCLDLPAQQSSVTPVKSNKSRAKSKKDNHDSTLAAAAAAATGDFDDDMDVLSQYLPAPNNNQNQSTRIEEPELAPPQEDESQTQDESTVLEGGIFAGLKFVFLGFESDEQKELLEFVVEKGGIIIQQNQRIVADFGVVPVLGYPVKVSVTDVVTYAWVKMCLEEDSFLDIDSNPLFRPIDIVTDSTPLDGCVLSVSGFAGTERNCIIELAETIGAKCQDYFVLRATKGHEPCTHLVVNAPKGSKYNASVKWNIPAVDKSWIFTCARLGRQLPVDYFLIEKMFNAGKVQKEATPQSETIHKDIPEKDNVPKTVMPEKEKTSTTIPVTSNNDDEDEEIVFKGKDEKVQTPRQNKTSLESNKESEKRIPSDRRVEKELRSSGEDKVPSSSAEEVKSDDLNPMCGILDRMKHRALQDNQMSNVNSPKHRTKLPNMNSPKPTVPNSYSEPQKSSSPKPHIVNPRSYNSPKPQILKTDPPQAYNSPQLKHNRLQDLKPGTPATPGTPGSPDGTPSKFLKPGVIYSPKFDFSDLISKYEAMDEANESLNVSDIFQQATEYTSVPVDRCPTPLVTRKQSVVVKPLTGVTIYVSKKLSAKMSQFHDIVSDLGGDYQHKYTPRCTHVIFQGKANDLNKEFRKARDENKTIVSPHWLQACFEKKERVDEALYPHNYNPKLALNVLSSTPRATPVRSQKHMSRGTRANNSQQTSENSAPTSNQFPVLNLKDHIDSDETDVAQELAIKKTEHKRKEERHSSDSDRKTSPVLRGRKGGKSSSSEGEIEQKSGDGDEEATEDKQEDVGMETGGTLEMKIAFSKQLDDMMSKSKKPGRKRSLKRLNSSGQLNASGNMSDSRPSSRQENWDKSEKRKTRSKGKSNEDYSGPTESQSVLVTWDDPVGRLEKEKLAAKLEQACSPTQTQNTDDCMAGLDMPEDAQYSEVEESSSTDDDKKKTRSREKRTPTPEAPSLAFPVNRKSSVTRPPQPVELLEEETAAESTVPVQTNYVFLLSGMSNEERVEYGALIEELGGKLLDGQHFNAEVTHLVTGSPGRNEKFLACVASGKWILHKSYFEACRQQKKFASEELYEWGGEYTKSLRGINKAMLHLATAAHTWRQRIQEMKKNNESGGAFVGWKVVLYTEKSKEGNFSRLLKAGGAEVLPVKPPYAPDMSATHAFLELHKAPLDQSDLESLLRADILCLKPEYIPLHLSDPSAPHDNFIPTEIAALKASLPDINPSKRKFNISNSSNKRSRKQ